MTKKAREPSKHGTDRLMVDRQFRGRWLIVVIKLASVIKAAISRDPLVCCCTFSDITFSSSSFRDIILSNFFFSRLLSLAVCCLWLDQSLSKRAYDSESSGSLCNSIMSSTDWLLAAVSPAPISSSSLVSCFNKQSKIKYTQVQWQNI